MVKRLFQKAVLTAAAVLMAGCAELEVGTLLRNDPAASGPVKVGVIAPLSGVNRFYGERI